MYACAKSGGANWGSRASSVGNQKGPYPSGVAPFIWAWDSSPHPNMQEVRQFDQRRCGIVCNYDPSSEALPLTITDGDVEGKSASDISGVTHTDDLGARDLRLSNTAWRH